MNKEDFLRFVDQLATEKPLNSKRMEERIRIELRRMVEEGSK